jgi:hypothetical protein
MNIKAIGWVGVKTDQFQAMSQFALKTLGLKKGQTSGDFIELLAENGDRLELNGPDAAIKPWEFRPNAVMVGFLVEDIYAATQELSGVPGIELLGHVQLEGGVAWQDFRAPDGNVYELTANVPGK